MDLTWLGMFDSGQGYLLLDTLTVQGLPSGIRRLSLRLLTIRGGTPSMECHLRKLQSDPIRR
jgi:hypothetical protein